MKHTRNDKNTPADPASAHVVTTFHPFSENTQATVTLVRGVAPRTSALRVWSGYLPVCRADLAGLGAATVARLLSDALARHLPGPDGEPLALDQDSTARERSGAPLGATGGTVTTLPGQRVLPGM